MNNEEMEIVLHDLADIIWWIKGYNASSFDTCDLNNDHIESLRKTRLFFKRKLNKKEDK